MLLMAAQALAAWTTRKDDDVFVSRGVAAFEKIGVRPIVPVGYTPGGSPLYPPAANPYDGIGAVG